MTSARGIGAHASNPLRPWRVLQDASEVVGVSTIDHEIRGITISSLVDLVDRVGQTLASRQGAIGLDCERHDHGQAGGTSGSNQSCSFAGLIEGQGRNHVSLGCSEPTELFGEIIFSRFHRNFCLGPISVSARAYHRVQHYWLRIPAEALSQIGDETETVFIRSPKFGTAGMEGTRPMRVRFPGNAVEDETCVHLPRQL